MPRGAGGGGKKINKPKNKKSTLKQNVERERNGIGTAA